MAELALIALSVLVCGYTCYVNALVIQADFYTRSQKVIQCLMTLLLPLVGGLLVHWFYKAHQAPAHTTDRAFIPQQDSGPDEWRAFHRPPDPPGD